MRRSVDLYEMSEAVRARFFPTPYPNLMSLIALDIEGQGRLACDIYSLEFLFV
jgi:hypothetical protein